MLEKSFVGGRFFLGFCWFFWFFWGKEDRCKLLIVKIDRKYIAIPEKLGHPNKNENWTKCGYF